MRHIFSSNNNPPCRGEKEKKKTGFATNWTIARRAECSALGSRSHEETQALHQGQ
jgi:hypothetical protein